MTKPKPPQTPGAATPVRGRLRASRLVVVTAVVGAAIGAWSARSGKSQPISLGSLLSPMAIALYLWMVLSLYWGWAARNKSAVKSAESGRSRAFHLLLVNTALIVAFWPFAGWPRLAAPTFEFPRVLPPWPYLAPIGLTVAVGSLLLTIWARHHLGRNWSAEVTVKVDHELVRSGPYRRIRHPIYTGAIGMYVGTALISGRLQGPLSLALIGIAYARKIRQEERALLAEFGAAYEDYRRESWAVFPWVV